MKLLLHLLLSLLHLATTSSSTTTTPPPSLLNAAETLSNSGYTAMSLILTSTSLPLNGATTLTIFTPPDSSFSAAGQPSLSRLLLHFSPLSLSLSSLSSLPFATRLPSLSPSNSPLLITTPPDSPHHLSINNVNVHGSPIFDDGKLIVFAVDDFFPHNFTIDNPPGIPSPDPPQCSGVSQFSGLLDAATKLKARGYSIMASFLELQVMGYSKMDGLELTMFAPEDEVLVRFIGDVGSYSGLLMQHLLPCRLSYADLSGVKNGTIFTDNFEGLKFMVERTDNGLFVNGVEVSFPDLYFGDRIVIHGISDAITLQPDGVVGDGEMVEQDEHSVSSYEEKADEQPVSSASDEEAVSSATDEKSVSSASYEEALSPNGTEL